MISNVRGQFSRLSGVLTLDESDVTKSKVEASIDAASIDTRDDQRDTHLRSADFLDVENYPWLSFISTRIDKVEIGERSVQGDLTIRGVT